MGTELKTTSVGKTINKGLCAHYFYSQSKDEIFFLSQGFHGTSHVYLFFPLNDSELLLPFGNVSFERAN